MSLELTIKEFGLHAGKNLGPSHTVSEILGDGTYGVVAKCWNLDEHRMEAVKVSKDNPASYWQVKEEIAVLKQLRSLCSDTCGIVKWNGFFFHKQSICLSFELLDKDIFDYMKERDFMGLSIKELRPIIQQLATALSHLESLRIVHADLKPENIMVVDSQQQPLRVKLIDFGLSHRAYAPVPLGCVQTLIYMAPEVLINMPFSEPIDMWSLGVTVAELVLGEELYPGHTEYDMLSYIVETQGQPEDHLLDEGDLTHRYFIQQDNALQRWRFKTPRQFQGDTGSVTEGIRSRKLNSLDDLKQWMKSEDDQDDDKLFLLDLIKQMMQLNPHERIKPHQVLQHPLFGSRPDVQKENFSWFRNIGRTIAKFFMGFRGCRPGSSLQPDTQSAYEKQSQEEESPERSEQTAGMKDEEAGHSKLRPRKRKRDEHQSSEEDEEDEAPAGKRRRSEEEGTLEEQEQPAVQPSVSMRPSSDQTAGLKDKTKLCPRKRKGDEEKEEDEAPVGKRRRSEEQGTLEEQEQPAVQPSVSMRPSCLEDDTLMSWDANVPENDVNREEESPERPDQTAGLKEKEEGRSKLCPRKRKRDEHQASEEDEEDEALAVKRKKKSRTYGKACCSATKAPSREGSQKVKTIPDVATHQEEAEKSAL